MLYRITRAGRVLHSHPVAGHWDGQPRWHAAAQWHRNEPGAHTRYLASHIEWENLIDGTPANVDLVLDALGFAYATNIGVRRWEQRIVRRPRLDESPTLAPANLPTPYVGHSTQCSRHAASAHSTPSAHSAPSDPGDTAPGAPNFRTVSGRRFGVEIECVLPRGTSLVRLMAAFERRGLELQDSRYTHATVPYWKAVHDGSLSADYGETTVEIVSPVLSGTAGMDALRLATEALAECGAFVNLTCGLHVHHDANGLTGRQVADLVTGYRSVQPIIDSLLRAYRSSTTSQWCAAWEPDMILELADCESIEDVAEVQRNARRSRYYAVNTLAYNTHHTVEMRQYHATTSGREIAAWVRLGQAMVACAQRGTSAFGSDLPDMLATLGVNAGDRAYWLAMQARRDAARHASAYQRTANG